MPNLVKTAAGIGRVVSRLASGSTMASRAFLKAYPAATSMARGIQGLRSLVKNDRARFIAGLVAYGLIDEAVDHVFDHLLADEDEAVRSAATQALEEIESYRRASGFDVTPHEDATIVGKPVSELELPIEAYITAQRYFEDAARAVGGKSRLLALMHWQAVDDDLKTLVLKREYFS